MQTLDAVLLRNDALFDSVGLSVSLIKLYARAPIIVPKIGPSTYIHRPLNSRIINAGPILLAGFIEPPETGLREYGLPIIFE